MPDRPSLRCAARCRLISTLVHLQHRATLAHHLMFATFAHPASYQRCSLPLDCLSGASQCSLLREPGRGSESRRVEPADSVAKLWRFHIVASGVADSCETGRGCSCLVVDDDTREPYEQVTEAWCIRIIFQLSVV